MTSEQPSDASSNEEDASTGVAEDGKASKWNVSLPVNLRLLILGSLVALFVAANFPFAYEPHHGAPLPWKYRVFDFGFDRESWEKVVYPVEAGWPFRFYIRHQPIDEPAQVLWITEGLTYNVLIGAAVLIMACLYLRFAKRGKRGLSLADTLLAVAIIAAVLGYWRLQKRYAETELKIAQDLGVSGTVVRQTLVPTAIQSWIPEVIRRDWSRIVAVSLLEPNDSQIDALCRLSQLRSLRIGGGEYDITHLRRLPSMRYLQDVRISGVELDSEAVLCIAACPMVSQLNVNHTNCGPDSVEAFGGMPRLKRLMAVGTSIPTDAWQSARLKDSLKNLVVSRPETGQASEVVIEGWPQLEFVAFQSLDGYRNSQPFEITIRDCPKLNDLTIDAFQKIDLDLQRLPALAVIDLDASSAQMRMSSDEFLPMSFWARNIVLKDLPVLTKCLLYAKEVESLEIERCPALEVIALSSRILPGSGQPTNDPSVSSDQIQKLVDSISTFSGPDRVSIQTMNLMNVDLGSLANNRGIKSLNLSKCALSPNQLDQLDGMPIEILNLTATNVDNETVDRFVKQLPNLKELHIDSTINAISIENRTELELIQFDSHKKSATTYLHLVDVPKLTSPMVVNPVGQHVHIDNANSLYGLAVLCVPHKIHIRGVAGLTWFVGGGNAITQEIAAEILKAKNLQYLTLAFTQADAATLQPIFSYPTLTELAIPGHALDNGAILDWEIPSVLRDLDIRQCGLSEQAINKILDRGDWLTLSIAGNAIALSDLKLLNKSYNVRELALGDIRLDVATVDLLEEFTELETVDLSGATIESGALTKFVDKCPRLSELHLTGATLDWSEIPFIVQANRMLRLKLSAVDGPTSLITRLTNDGRLLRSVDAFEHWFRPPDQRLRGYDSVGNPVYWDGSEDAGPSQFQRPDWSPDFFRPENAIPSMGPPVPRRPPRGGLFQGILQALGGSSNPAPTNPDGDDESTEPDEESPQ